MKIPGTRQIFKMRHSGGSDAVVAGGGRLLFCGFGCGCCGWGSADGDSGTPIQTNSSPHTKWAKI